MKNTFKQEQGRSMVEILGVLAIVGVLSVAGIAGYSVAMRSYRTNEIVNAASMFYVLAKSQNQGNGPSGDIRYADVGGTNPSGATLTYTNNAFIITFTDPDDCTMTANKLGDKATTDCANKKITVNFGENNNPSEDTPVENSYENFPDGMQCDEGVVCYINEGYDGFYYCSLRAECVDGALDSQTDECCDTEEEGCFEKWNIPACNTVL